MRFLTPLTLIASALILWGCSRSDDNRISQLTPFGSCLPGQVVSSTGQCLNQNGCPAGQGYDPALGQCVNGSPVDPNAVYQSQFPSAYSKSLQITNRNAFESFLEKVGGVCDFSGFFYFNFFGPNPYDCDTYSKQGFIIMEFYPQVGFFGTQGNTPAYVTIGAGATSLNDGFYGGGYWGGGNYVTVPLNMTAFPINNDEGFELRSDGVFFGGLGSTISVRASAGQYGIDQNFQVILSHDGVEFARAFVERYY